MSEHAVNVGNVNGWLVATDIDAIQSYLLQSVHLNTIAGASRLVASADEQLAKYGGQAIVASGGIGLIQFDDKSDAEAFGTAMSDWFRQQSVSGHLSVSEPQAVSSRAAFGQHAARAFKNLDRRKRAGHRQGEVVTLPQGRGCQSCGEELASQQVRVGRPPDAEDRWLGAACLRKQDERDWYFWLNWLRAGASDRNASWQAFDPEKSVAHDFNRLAGDHDLGLIVADADGTGRILKRLESCGKQDWIDFSRKLDTLSRDALTHAINEIVPKTYVDDLGSGYLPVLPLFCGGDDFVIACRGDLALPLASSLCRFFAQAPKTWCPGGQLGLSAAVVVTRPGFPFRIAHRIASELLHGAKRETKRMGWSADGVGAIDYALITESMADKETILADRTVESDRQELTLQLSGRPYRAADCGPRSIGGLAAAVAELQVGKFPRAKLRELKAMCARTNWLASHVQPNLAQVNELREEMDWTFTDWARRTMRRIDLAEALRKVQEHLGHLGADGEARFWLSRGVDPVDSGEYRTQLGDLVDAVRLFGNLSNEDEADDEMPH